MHDAYVKHIRQDCYDQTDIPCTHWYRHQALRRMLVATHKANSCRFAGHIVFGHGQVQAATTTRQRNMENSPVSTPQPTACSTQGCAMQRGHAWQFQDPKAYSDLSHELLEVEGGLLLSSTQRKLACGTYSAQRPASLEPPAWGQCCDRAAGLRCTMYCLW